MNKAELFIDCKNKLGEGITWDHDDQTLYWLDIPMPSKLYKHSLETKKTSEFEMPEMITAMAIRPNNDILIAKRQLGGLLGGLWEFPGGKLSDSESAEECVIREIQEEVGINVEIKSFPMNQMFCQRKFALNFHHLCLSYKD